MEYYKITDYITGEIYEYDNKKAFDETMQQIRNENTITKYNEDGTTTIEYEPYTITKKSYYKNMIYYTLVDIDISPNYWKR